MNFEIFSKKKHKVQKKENNSDLITMITETFLINDEVERWIDTCASLHIPRDRNSFKDCEVAGDDMMMYMKNSSSPKIGGKDTVQLKFSSSKIIILKDLLHVPEIRRSSFYGTLLSEHGFKMVFESDKFIW